MANVISHYELVTSMTQMSNVRDIDWYNKSTLFFSFEDFHIDLHTEITILWTTFLIWHEYLVNKLVQCAWLSSGALEV